MSEEVLNMSHITKKFPGVVALNDVTISAYKGEILSICGENGAGKSTLMKILSGSYSYDSYSGEIHVEGNPVHFSNTSQSELAGIAMIYQELNMHLDLSVAENLFLGKWNQFGRVIKWKELEKEAQQYIDLVGVDVSPHETLRNISASKQQLIAIARALQHKPRILVLDEPTASLTTTESDKLFSLVHELKEKGYTCILISHKLDEVFEHSDRIIVMRDGQVINQHDRSTFEQNAIIAEMVGRKLDNLYPKETAQIGQTVLSVRNITVPHPQNAKKSIVKDVSFEVHEGEILGIGGLVGAGRSELVNAIFGKIGRTAGKIEMYGSEIKIHTPQDAIQHKIALVTEDRKQDGFVAGMTIGENISLASLKYITKHGMLNKKIEEEKVNHYFSELKIKAENIYTRMNTLSGGNQQKVVLSKWIMQNPKVLILDEPTRGIDVGTKYEIYKIMVQLAKQGVAIIMISSELSELISMSDRIIVLAEGRISGEVSGKEVTQEKIMQFATQF